MISETTEISEPMETEEPVTEAPEDVVEEDESGIESDAAAEDDADDEEGDEDGPDEAAGEDQPDEAPGEDEPGESDFDNLRLVEALLFASSEPLAPAQLARFLPEDTNIEPLLADLEALYANRGVNLVKRGGRWAFRTAPDLSPRMELENKVVRKLSRVALETLSVIAYHQPVTRAEIEEIRGVALSKGTLDALLEIGWIRPKGRRKTPGRPVTWATSDSFLDHFGLEGLDALPGVEELKAAGLLDARPALAALSDRGLLPSAGDVMPEPADDEDEDDDDENDLSEASERELLDASFGEDLLPREVESNAQGSEEESDDTIGAEDHAEPTSQATSDAEAEDDLEESDPEQAELEDGGEAEVGEADTTEDSGAPKRSLG